MGSAGTLQAHRLEPAQPLAPAADALVVYVLNVGDGDAIVLQFSDDGAGRAYAVVDSNDDRKTLDLLQHQLEAPALRLVCATHPHLDHIRGLPSILRAYRDRVEEFWDSGFRYTSRTYNRVIAEVGGQLSRPTSGFETFIKGVRVTVLSPSILLRNRYDTYGVDPNNASIVLRLEYPTLPPIRDFPAGGGAAAGDGQMASSRSIILGGDAQADAWSRVIDEFPHLVLDRANWARQINVRQGRQPLLCDVLKVAHHCSKHGINLELLERMGDRSGAGASYGPRYLVSSCADGVDSRHGFPHAVCQEIMREVRDPQADAGGAHPPDDELGIHYTAQRIDDTDPSAVAGSIAVVMDSGGRPPVLYRLGDDVRARVDLTRARRVVEVAAAPSR